MPRKSIEGRKAIRGHAWRRLLASFPLLASVLLSLPAPEAPAQPEPAPDPPVSATPERRRVERPWTYWAENPPPPGEPGRDYRPVFVPDGRTLPYRIRGGAKIFHLTAEPIEQRVADGLLVKTWGYNGGTPGPLIEVVQGDRVRIYVTNHLPAQTTVHWHGVILPNGMDGVPGLTQPAIKPGETFRYEYIFPDHGTFMYHPHFDGMTQDGSGLIGMIVVHPREPEESRPDRDFSLMFHEWDVEAGTYRPNTIENVDFNVLTVNGRAFPNTHPLVARLGDRVRIRMGNLSTHNHHPIHLHGHSFEIVETDGGQVPLSARQPETTALVKVGSVRVIDVTADNPGDWLLHCHMTHHTMNQMGHNIPNMVGLEPGEVEKQIQDILPGFKVMGHKGMMPLQMHDLPVPENSIPMLGFRGRFGLTVLGGMVTTLKVREGEVGYEDPGPYQFPEGTVARKATDREMREDGIEAGERMREADSAM